MPLQLLSATPSPYARKVRIALTEKRIPFELITEVPWHSSTKTPLHNPLEKLPILIFDDDRKPIYDSSYILEYLEAKFPETRPLLPEDVDMALAAKQVQVVTGKSWGREVTAQREVDYPPFNFFTKSTSEKYRFV